MMKKQLNGFASLSILILLSSILLLLLLVNDDLLHTHLATHIQRQQYAQQDLALQFKTYQQFEKLCENVPLFTHSKVEKIVISHHSPQDKSNKFDEISHYLACKRIQLFKMQPKQNLKEKEFNDYIEQENLVDFKVESGPPNLWETKEPKLYWYSMNNAQVQLNGNFDGILIAEGNLTISGTGTIKGAIITGREFNKADQVRLAYNAKIVEKLYQQYSYWQAIKGTWYDIKND